MCLPYRILLENDLALFTTEKEAKYLARFQMVPNIEDDQLAGLIFDFSFWRDESACTNKVKLDRRIKPTIQKLVSFFFEQGYYNIMYFVCESLDKKQKGRKQLFDSWCGEYNKEFELIPFHFLSNSGDILGGIVFRRNHPMEAAIRAYAESEILVYSATKGALNVE